MKYLFTVLLFILFVLKIDAQWHGLDFEFTSTPYESPYYEIDSGSIWQVGTPQKNILDTAFYGTRVIMTDTVNPYPPNDTSSFTVIQPITTYDPNYTGWGTYTGHYFGWVNVDTDTILDYMIIESSFDGGSSWVSFQILQSGSSNGWRFFGVDFSTLMTTYNIQTGDTLLHKFTFISDSINNNRDGIMLDGIEFHDVYMNTENIESTQLKINTYPNPATDVVYIHIPQIPNKENLHLGLYHLEGKLLREKAIPNTNESYQMDLQDLPRATYILQLRDQKGMILGAEKIILGP